FRNSIHLKRRDVFIFRQFKVTLVKFQICSFIVYYIHGGGFVLGEAAWGHFCAVNIARKCKKNIVLVNYRLAPKYHFPVGINDCITGYEWMLNQGIKAENIVFLGESAGGNLVLATAIGCKQRNIPQPAGIAAISPVVDLNFQFPSYRERINRECIIPYNQDRFAQHEYMEDKDLSNPLASPYYGDCKGFPPVFLGVSTEESLFDDSIRMHEKLLKEGVDSRLVVWENMWHTFYMLDFPESWSVFEQVSDFYLNL
ncbi:MAG: alpha/beta hydrolase, partial [Clostridia bacterium]|nr:alpha/beta hydrolase [Clostridia bacterium]